MNYLRTLIFFSGVLFYSSSIAQTKESFLIKMDSIEIDIYNNVDFDTPNQLGIQAPPLKIDLNNLPEPTLILINGKETQFKKFSEVSPTIDEIETVEIIKNSSDLQKRGFNNYKSAVMITTKIE